MWSRLRSALFFAVLFAATLLAMPQCAHAAAPRPNALDHAVDAMSNRALLTQPATALVDPARDAGADRLVRLMLPGWFATMLLQIVTLAYFWQAGFAARLRDWLRRRVRTRFALRFSFGAALALAARLAAFLPDAYLYRISREMSLNDELLRAWLAGWLVNTIVTMVLAGVIVGIVLWLVDRTHQWYLYTIGAIIVANVALALLGPFLVLPRFGAYTALPAPYASAVARLERRAHVRVSVREHVRDRTHLGGATVEGLGPSSRIVVADALIQGSSLPEFEYAIAHELGYIRVGGPWRVVAADSIFTILGIAFAVGVADRIGFRRDDDPLVRVALVAALMGVAYLAIVPFDNAMLRSLADESERYAIQLTGDRAAAVRSIVRMADQRLDDVCEAKIASMYLGRIQDPAHAVEIANGVPASCGAGR